MAKKIIEFYEGGCVDCILIAPAVQRLEEEGVEMEKLEVKSNEENRKRMESLKELFVKECGGNFSVPSFYDEESHRLICEPMSYEILKNWIFKENA